MQRRLICPHPFGMQCLAEQLLRELSEEVRDAVESPTITAQVSEREDVPNADECDTLIRVSAALQHVEEIIQQDLQVLDIREIDSR